MVEKTDKTGCLTNKYVSNAELVNDSVKNKIEKDKNILKEIKNNKLDSIEQNESKETKSIIIPFKELKGASFHHGSSFKKRSPRWIVVHYTAMPGVSAKKCTESFAKTSKSVSTHFFCDSEDVYRVVDEKHVAWHVCGGQVEQPIKNKKLTNEQLVEYGDKYNWRFKMSAENHIKWKKNNDDFIGNYDSFSVDICCIKKSKKTQSVVDQDWDFNPKAIINAAKVVAYLCKKYGIDLEHVIRHGDATGKPCPRPFVSLPGDDNKTINDDRWCEFKLTVQKFMEEI